MTRIIENTANRTRNLPIVSRLKRILSIAGSEAGIDEVRVESGGQCAIGTCSRRIGSTRHDLGNAADLDLYKDGRRLDFTRSSELPFFERFVEFAASYGATGIGGDVSYMGSTRIHVGFGSRATWGKNGGGVPAPAWLANAASRGWQNPRPLPPDPNTPSLFLVNARSGLNLRRGPGTGFSIITTLPTGTVVTVQDFDGTDQEWAKVDLEGDGTTDGYLFRTFLRPVQQRSNSTRFSAIESALEIDDGGDNCAPDNEHNILEAVDSSDSIAEEGDFLPCGIREEENAVESVDGRCGRRDTVFEE